MFVADVRSEVARLSGEGARPNEIARRLGVAGPTVRYHLERLAAMAGPCPPAREQQVRPSEQVSATSYDAPGNASRSYCVVAFPAPRSPSS